MNPAMRTKQSFIVSCIASGRWFIGLLIVLIVGLSGEPAVADDGSAFGVYRLYNVHIYPDSSLTDADKVLVVEVKGHSWTDANNVRHLRIDEFTCDDSLDATCKTKVKTNTMWYVKGDEFAADTVGYEGFTTGGLVVPFKYHVTDHAVTGGSTIGGYIGYTKDLSWAGSMSLILSGGLAIIDTSAATSNYSASSSSSTNSGTGQPAGSTTSLNGFTVATGVIGKIGKTQTQFGVLLGYDMVNKSQNYKYDGRPWVSFTVGYNFSN